MKGLSLKETVKYNMCNWKKIMVWQEKEASTNCSYTSDLQLVFDRILENIQNDLRSQQLVVNKLLW